MDISAGGTGNATGLGSGEMYISKGTQKSTYREGNATVQWDVLPEGSTYNTTLNGPNPGSVGEKTAREFKKELKRELKSALVGREIGERRWFKPAGGRG